MPWVDARGCAILRMVARKGSLGWEFPVPAPTVTKPRQRGLTPLRRNRALAENLLRTPNRTLKNGGRQGIQVTIDLLRRCSAHTAALVERSYSAHFTLDSTA